MTIVGEFSLASASPITDHEGILSAIAAFLIVRAEMALFDLKEGFCASIIVEMMQCKGANDGRKGGGGSGI